MFLRDVFSSTPRRACLAYGNTAALPRLLLARRLGARCAAAGARGATAFSWYAPRGVRDICGAVRLRHQVENVFAPRPRVSETAPRSVARESTARLRVRMALVFIIGRTNMRIHCARRPTRASHARISRKLAHRAWRASARQKHSYRQREAWLMREVTFAGTVGVANQARHGRVTHYRRHYINYGLSWHAGVGTFCVRGSSIAHCEMPSYTTANNSLRPTADCLPSPNHLPSKAAALPLPLRGYPLPVRSLLLINDILLPASAAVGRIHLLCDTASYRGA